MLLGFKRQFKPYILNRTKRHTVRDLRKRRPRAGEPCHCYVDPRQKTMELLGRWQCSRVEPFTARFILQGISYGLELTIGDQTLTPDEAENFAWADGFRDTSGRSSLDQMSHFWVKAKRLTDGVNSKPWHGEVIYWDCAIECDPPKKGKKK